MKYHNFSLFLSLSILLSWAEANYNYKSNVQNSANQVNDRVIERSQKLSDDLIVNWSVNFDTETIVFRLVARTTGFIAFGLSISGALQNSDVVIGGVHPDGSSYFTDRFVVDPSLEPKIDLFQNWHLTFASQNTTHTTLIFHRKLDTCDPQDVVISMDTIRLIWQLGATDNLQGPLTGTTTVTLYLLDPPSPFLDPSTIDTWILEVNTTMPPIGTSYYCTFHKSPQFNEPRQIVGFRVKLENPQALKYNHHLLLHICTPLPGTPAGNLLENYTNTPGGFCYDDDNTGVSQIMALYCQRYIFAWGVGGQAVIMPENVGIPFNQNGQEFYAIEIHRTNPKLETVTYATGVDIYTTKILREIEGDLMTVGHFVDATLIVPDGVPHHVISSHCTSECTQKSFPPEGIKVFNILLHSHLLGRKLRLRHFRPTTYDCYEELPWVSSDSNWVFGLQMNRPLLDYVTILPGDHLIYECTYNSSDRAGKTLGGLTTQEEMALTFFFYYPKLKSNLGFCGSKQTEFPFSAFGVDKLLIPYSYSPILAPAKLAGEIYSDYLNSLEWSAEFKKKLENGTRFGSHVGVCLAQNDWDTFDDQGLPQGFNTEGGVPGVTYPKCFNEHHPPPRKCYNY